MKKIILLFLLVVPAYAMNIGYFDTSRATGTLDDFATNAKQSLLDSGHSLQSTSGINGTFLSNVDAFYTGNILSLSSEEVSALHNFVDIQGGFLFFQLDNGFAEEITTANSVLNHWDIVVDNTTGSSPGSVVNSSSPWMSGATGSYTSATYRKLVSTSSDFIRLAEGDNGDLHLGVLESDVGRAGNVFISTEYGMWFVGGLPSANETLWDNIWNNAANVTSTEVVPEPSSFFTIGLALVFLAFKKKKTSLL